MLNKKDGTTTYSPSQATTLIAQGTHIVGNIQFQGSLEIEGDVTGDIVAEDGTDARVRVLESGQVKGEIRVPAVVINGQVEGDIHAAKLVELAARAVVKGNVHYSLVEIEKGAQVNGSLVHTNGGMAKNVEQLKPKIVNQDQPDS